MNEKKFESAVIDILDDYEGYFDRFEMSDTSNNNNNFNQQPSDSKLSELTLPSASMSRLVLIMIRHTILVICYQLWGVLRSITPIFIQGSSRQRNMFEILTNLTIYMLYPVGDFAYECFCIAPTQKIFSKWYMRYVEKKAVEIDSLAEREGNISSMSRNSKRRRSTTKTKSAFNHDEDMSLANEPPLQVQQTLSPVPSSVVLELSSKTASYASLDPKDKLLRNAQASNMNANINMTMNMNMNVSKNVIAQTDLCLG